MRVYYIFRIVPQIKNIYSEKDLYMLFNNMYYFNDINYEISQYNRICRLIDVDAVSSYLNSICNNRNKNKYLMDKTLIEINKSVIIIKTKINIPYIFKILNIYSKDLFVVDFDNLDYFWLNELLKR